MVHAKILINFEEYQRLKQMEERCNQVLRAAQKSDVVSEKNKKKEQEGAGSNSLQELREEIRGLRQEIRGIVKASGENQSSLVTPQAAPLAPITIPEDSSEIEYSKQSTGPSSETYVMPLISNESMANQDTWYYLGPI